MIMAYSGDMDGSRKIGALIGLRQRWLLVRAIDPLRPARNNTVTGHWTNRMLDTITNVIGLAIGR